jgi:lipoprotein-anchoring transpeptidase ErfK/SrfK
VQTIKTAAVVVLMMSVLYGIFIAINNNEPALPPGLADLALDDPNMDIELGDPIDGDNLVPSVPLADSSGIGTKELGANELAIPQTPAPEMLENLGVEEPLGSGPTDPSQLVDIPKVDSSARDNAATDPQNMRSTPQANDDLLNQTSRNKSFLPVSTPVPNTVSGSGTLPGNNTAFPSSGTTAGNLNPNGSTLIPSPPQLADTSSAIDSPTPSPANATPLSALAANNSTPSPLPTASTIGNDSRPNEVAIAELSYADSKEKALAKAQDGKLKEALIQMTAWYGRAELTYDEKADLLNLLNALAAEVIYSRRHFLESSYKAGPRESLEDIAKLHGISLELLASINQIPTPYILLPNTELKVLRGPFRAEVDLTTKELTLYLDNMFAGQFPISVGSDTKEIDGSFSIMSKQTNRNYYAANGGTVSHTDPNNPYGKHWLDLGQDLCIHGSAAAENSPLNNAGCISLSPRDAEDVYNILTVGSKVTIKR